MGGFAIPSCAPNQGAPPILAPPGAIAEPGGYALVPARLLSPLGPAEPGQSALSPAAVLAWIVLTLEYGPDGGGVRLQLADLASRLGRSGTADSGRRLGADIRQLETTGWLKSVRDPRGKRYWPQRLVDPRRSGRPGWYATISRADLARIGQALDPADPAGGVVTEADLVAWAHWQGIVRCDQVHIGLTQIAERLGVSRRTAETVTARLIRGGWLVVDRPAGGAGTYKRADLKQPVTERDLAYSPPSANGEDLPDEPTQNQTHHPRKTRHMHSYLSASTRSLPPSPPAEPAGSAARPAATGEGSTTSEITTTGDPMSVLNPAAAAKVEQICDAVASAWPTPVGRPPIHRDRLRQKLLTTAAIERLGVQLLTRHLTENQGAVRDPLAVVLARLDALPPAPPSSRPEAPWCGSCDSNVSRLAIVGHEQDGAEILAPCEVCGGGSPKRTARAIALVGGSATPSVATGAPKADPGAPRATKIAARGSNVPPAAPTAESAPGVDRDQPAVRPPNAGYLDACSNIRQTHEKFVRLPAQIKRVGWRNAPGVRDDG